MRQDQDGKRNREPDDVGSFSAPADSRNKVKRKRQNRAADKFREEKRVVKLVQVVGRERVETARENRLAAGQIFLRPEINPERAEKREKGENQPAREMPVSGQIICDRQRIMRNGR